MSKPSFTLFRKGATWWVRFTAATGKPAEFSTGTGDRAKAEGIAEVRVPQKISIGKAGMKRWEKKRGTVAAIKKELGAAGGSTAPTTTPVEGVSLASDPPAPASPPPAPAPGVPKRDPVDAAAVAGKLRALGDSQPIGTDVDAYIPPGDKQTDEDAPTGEADTGDGSADNEAGELIADMLAVGTISFIVRTNAKIAKKMKPPRRLAEPNERMTDWAGKGLSYNYRKLVGNAGALGPTGKMFVGIVGMCLTMWWDAEEIGSTPRATTEHASPATAPSGAEVRARNGVAHGNDVGAPAPAPPPSPEAAPPSGELALGRFS